MSGKGESAREAHLALLRLALDRTEIIGTGLWLRLLLIEEQRKREEQRRAGAFVEPKLECVDSRFQRTVALLYARGEALFHTRTFQICMRK